jgi:hypothetical protein
MIARAAGVHSASDAKTANDGWRRTLSFDYTFDIPVEVAAAVCKYRHDRWKFEWGNPQFTRLYVAIASDAHLGAHNCEVRFTPLNGHRAAPTPCPKSANIRHEASFDHVVCASRERRRHIEPEDLGSL